MDFKLDESRALAAFNYVRDKMHGNMEHMVYNVLYGADQMSLISSGRLISTDEYVKTRIGARPIYMGDLWDAMKDSSYSLSLLEIEHLEAAIENRMDRSIYGRAVSSKLVGDLMGSISIAIDGGADKELQNRIGENIRLDNLEAPGEKKKRKADLF